MNMKINPYIVTLIKENGVYVAASILLVSLTGIIIWLSVAKNTQNQQKISDLSSEVKTLNTNNTLLTSALANKQDLDADLQLLNQLIPDTEDYFSIIYALDRLSQKTGFLITAYTVNLDQSTTNKLRLSITGTGDSKAFLNFLQTYNFGGNRLITSDKIELSPQMYGSIKIDVSFYNKKAGQSQDIQPSFNSKSLVELNALREKIQFSLKSATSGAEVNFAYPRKANPF